MRGFYDKNQLERIDKANAEIRANAPEHMRALIAEVDAAFEEEKTGLDQRLAEESKLRTWAKTLCGVELDISEIELLTSVCKVAQPGQMFTFHPKRSVFGPARLYKSALGQIFNVESLSAYINVLEKTVIDVTNNSQFTALPTAGLIKLAFKRLFKRSK